MSIEANLRDFALKGSIKAKSKLEELAKQKNNYKAKYELGIYLKESNDYVKAEYWLNILVEEIYINTEIKDDKLLFVLSAMRNLAQILNYKDYYRNDPKRAFDLYHKLKYMYPEYPKSVAATVELGIMYYSGEYKDEGIYDPGKGKELIEEWEHLYNNAYGGDFIHNEPKCGPIGIMFLKNGDIDLAKHYLSKAIKGDYYLESEYELRESFKEILASIST